MTTLPAPLWLRTLLGFVIAPVSPAVVIVCLGFLASGPSKYTETIFVALALYGYATALLVGVPFYIVLRWRRRNGWRTYLVAGPLLAVAALSIAITVIARSLSWLLDIEKLKLGFWIVACAGLVAAMCFWWIVRPDRNDEPAEPAPVNRQTHNARGFGEEQ